MGFSNLEKDIRNRFNTPLFRWDWLRCPLGLLNQYFGII